MNKNVHHMKENMIINFKEEKDNGGKYIIYETSASAIFGLGERYCSVNHKNVTLKNRVFEKFCEQGEDTYFPIPFYHCNDGHGVFINTSFEFEITFVEKKGINNEIKIVFDQDAIYDLYFIYGTPLEIIQQFIIMTGKNRMLPKWAFGIWISANRWNKQKNIEEQMEIAKKYDYPVNVVVIEAWSDEATFYMWNGSKYNSKKGKESFDVREITFQEPWPDPMHMINSLHKNGTKLVLWQIPVLKKLDEGQMNQQHLFDCDYALENHLVVKDFEEKPYRIPKQWFIGSYVPDFTNPQLIHWWFAKRQYLLDMGVDGFKTDGGEFIHDLDCKFYNGETGMTEKNQYPFRYEKAYSDFIGNNRVLFSRAGYLQSQTAPMHWAGDQLSKFKELKDVLKAGLSLAMSGIIFWSFDIAGFAGPMPSVDLYIKSTALAAFVPAMQWHSEPEGGQFSEILESKVNINDRSPWNVWNYHGKNNNVLKDALFYSNLHMNFLPYFYSEAVKCCQENKPFLKPLYLEYPSDEKVIDIDDEFMIGEILIAPILKENAKKREIYLPTGIWYNLWNAKEEMGGITVQSDPMDSRIPIYVKKDAMLVFHFENSYKLGAKISNRLENYERLTFVKYGDEMNYRFYDENGNTITFENGEIVKKEIPCEVFMFQEMKMS